MAGVHEDLPGSVIELRGLHRSHDGYVIHDGSEMRQQIRKFRSALPVASKRMRRAQQFRGAFDKSEALALDNVLRNRLPIVFIQGRLVVEQVELRGGAGHEQKN